MRPRVLIVLVCILGIIWTDSPALARSPRAKRSGQQTASTPPFPWTAVGETVGPILGIWLASVLLQRTLSRDKTSPILVAGEIASLPVAWFSAMSGLFEKNASERKTEPPPTSPATESLAPDFGSPETDATRLSARL